MGSWSLGSYGKKEACEMSWQLLTGPYEIEAEKLHITYFGGCPEKELKPDEETRDVWASLGVPKSHIRPSGPEDNFWTMAEEGPCGPCTEIYYDHGSHLVELWNLVFVAYNQVQGT